MAPSPIRVLLIEDQETDYLLARRMLSNAENQTFDLQWANSWQAGIEAIRRCAHDVCLLDFRLAGGDGLELLKESRDIGCKAPVIVLTGISDYRLDLEAMELGAADFLVKDKITPELLERSIRYSIAQAQAVDELHRRQDDLRVSELRFRSVVQSAGYAIILCNETGNIVFWNKGAELIFGYTENEIAGVPIENLMAEAYRAEYRAGFERFRVTGRSQIIGKTVELDGVRKDGTVFPLELSLASWTNGDGTMFTAIIRDVTERRRAENLRMAKEAAEEASRAKSAFVARMSHELRSPLHAIIGFTNLLLGNKRGNLTEQDKDFLGRILTNARDQLQLVNAVLDLSKVEAGRMDIHTESISVDTVVRDVVKQFEVEHQSPDVQIALRLPTRVRPIQADAQKMKQVLTNIIDNALKFTSHGAITIELNLKPGTDEPGRIDVTDTGVGIPAERISEIFEPFCRLEADSNLHPGGSGLGLSICRSLCDLMGYQLEVRSEPGLGSTFSIVFAESDELPLTA
jgi:two-component system, sensor histidine kinase and response regulator